MPEGDTVFLLARRLDRSLRGRGSSAVSCGSRPTPPPTSAGRTCWSTTRTASTCSTRFDAGLTLHTHLRMDGSWTVVGPGKRLPGKLMPDVRVLLACENGPTAYGLSLPVVE